MAKITGYNRTSHQTLITGGQTFSVPPSEDFTDGTWNIDGSELMLSEIGINEIDNKAYVRIGNNINQFSFIGGVNGNNLSQTLAIGNNSGTYSIVMGTATSITSNNGGAAISLDTYGLANNIFISTDGVGMESSIEMAPQLFSINNSTGHLTLSASTYSIQAVSNVEMTSGKVIKSNNGGGQIDLDYLSSSGEVSITTDNGNQGESYLYITPTAFTLSNQYGGIYSKPSGIRLGHSSKVSVTTDNIFTLYGSFNGITSQDVILVKDNFSTPSSSMLNDMPAVFIGSKNSTIDTGVKNSVILGGVGINATYSNSVYVPDLYIQSGKSIKSTNGGGQIDLDFMSSFLALSTDNGTFAESYIILGTNSWYTGSATNYLQNIDGDLYLATSGLNNISGNIVSISSSTGDIKISSTGDIKLITDPGKSVQVSTGTSIKSENGGGQIDLDYASNPNNVLISSDNGGHAESFIDLQSTSVNIGVDGGGTSNIQIDSNGIVSYGNAFTVASGNAFASTIAGTIQLASGTYSTYVQGLQFRKSTITNSSATSSTIATIPMVDGETITIEAKVNAVCTSPNRNYGARLMAVFLKYGGTIYQTGTTDIVAKDGFGDGTTTTIDTDGTNVRIRVTNGGGLTTRWVVTYDYLQSS